MRVRVFKHATYANLRSTHLDFYKWNALYLIPFVLQCIWDVNQPHKIVPFCTYSKNKCKLTLKEVAAMLPHLLVYTYAYFPVKKFDVSISPAITL